MSDTTSLRIVEFNGRYLLTEHDGSRIYWYRTRRILARCTTREACEAAMRLLEMPSGPACQASAAS